MSHQKVRISSSPFPKHIPELDGIRGFAIILVVIYHYLAVPTPPDADVGFIFLRQIASNGWSGVDLFFVLSGFLITGILIDNRTSNDYFKAFYIRRITRIFPLYYLFLLIFLLLQHAAPRTHLFSPDLFANPLPILPYFLYLQNFTMATAGTFGNEFLAQTWSLAIEEQFYLLLPLLVRLSHPKRLPLNLLFFIAITLTLRATLGQGTFSGFVLTPWRLDALFLGSLLAYAYRSPLLLDRLKSNLKWIQLAFTGLFLFFAYSSITEPLGSLDHLFAFALMYTLLIFLALISQTGFLARLFRNSLLMNIGRISYGIYILHQFVNGTLHDLIFKQPPSFHDFPTIMTTLIAFLVTYFLSVVSFHAFEKHFIASGHKFKYSSA